MSIEHFMYRYKSTMNTHMCVTTHSKHRIHKNTHVYTNTHVRQIDVDKYTCIQIDRYIDKCNYKQQLLVKIYCVCCIRHNTSWLLSSITFATVTLKWLRVNHAQIRTERHSRQLYNHIYIEFLQTCRRWERWTAQVHLPIHQTPVDNIATTAKADAYTMSNAVSKKREENKRKDYTFRRQLNVKWKKYTGVPRNAVNNNNVCPD